MTFFVFVFSVAMAVGSLAWGYSLRGLDFVIDWMLAFGALWLFAGWRRWTWFSAIGLFLTVAAAAFGLWYGFSTGWMLAGAIGGLLAWDLTDFMRRTRLAADITDLPGLERRHLARVTIVALLGLGLASISMIMRVEFTFEWIMLLAAVAVFGITQLAGWLRRRGE
ncbi:MAG: hypothetical protein Kow002_11680 [Anaerolineales bacterium]